MGDVDLIDGSQDGALRKNNYGNRSDGPWVLGIYLSPSQVRFIVISNRSATTLIPIIKRYVAKESVIITDEWGAYNALSANGFTHFTVCHKDNYVDPDTGYHTQGIERAWVDAKYWIKRSRYPSHHLQAHLDEVAWRKMNSTHSGGLLEAFFEDVARYYNPMPQ